MRKFIVTTFLFLLIPIMYFGLNVLFNMYQIQNSKPKLPKINYLILGDSHIQNTIDSKFFKNSVNYAKSGEPYAISYWKLKYIYAQPNVSIDTILLGFSHHDISKGKDLALSDEGASSQFKRTYGIHYYSEEDSLPIDFYKYYNVLFRNLALMPKKGHFGYQGKYAGLNKDLTKRKFYKEPIKNHNHFYYKKTEYGFSTSNIKYLDSIINFSHKINAKLILVATPVSQIYFENIPKPFLKRFEELKTEYRLKNLSVYDFSQVMKEDSLFADFNHLNGKGSQLFMKEYSEQFR